MWFCSDERYLHEGDLCIVQFRTIADFREYFSGGGTAYIKLRLTTFWDHLRGTDRLCMVDADGCPVLTEVCAMVPVDEVTHDGKCEVCQDDDEFLNSNNVCKYCHDEKVRCDQA